jgi:2-oxoglutarate-Fe(II)-dependent oxygenase superfamily protein
MKLVQIDNVIPKPYQDQLEAEASALGWYFHNETARPGVGFARTFGGFFHMAFDAASPVPVVSAINALLVPLLFVSVDKANLKFNDLIRVRLGMFPQTELDAPFHNPHADFYTPHLVGLYYLNDSDGDTVVFNETSDAVSLEQSVKYANDGRFTEQVRISPRKGKMVFFDGRHYHASMHPKTHSHRMVVTFNFR